MNAVTTRLEEILKDAPDTVLYKGRKTHALDDAECPLDTAAQYVVNELHKLVPPAPKKAKKSA